MQTLLLFLTEKKLLNFSFPNSTTYVNKKFTLHIFCDRHWWWRCALLFSFLVSLFGYWIAIRTISQVATEFSIPFRRQQLVSAFVMVVIVVLMGSTKSSSLTLWLFIGILLTSLKFFPIILRIFLNHRIRKVLIPYLDLVILNIQSGKSMHVSMREATEIQEGWIKNQLKEVHLYVFAEDASPPAKSALLKRFSTELHRIAHSQSKYFEQLKALRRELKMQEDFRRRSGQVTQQLKAQAIIVTALYLALLSFIILQFGFFENRKLILLSVIVFKIGLFWMFMIGRRMKWKV